MPLLSAPGLSMGVVSREVAVVGVPGRGSPELHTSVLGVWLPHPGPEHVPPHHPFSLQLPRVVAQPCHQAAA